MPDTTEVAIRQPDIKDALAHRTDFKAYANDVSNAVMSALERRHLECLDLRQVPVAAKIEPPGPGELRFLKLG